MAVTVEPAIENRRMSTITPRAQLGGIRDAY